MKANIGKTDKLIRLIVGLILIILALLISMSAVLKILLIIVGAVSLLTALFGYCLAYQLFGINTCKHEPKQ